MGGVRGWTLAVEHFCPWTVPASRYGFLSKDHPHVHFVLDGFRIDPADTTVSHIKVFVFAEHIYDGVWSQPWPLRFAYGGMFVVASLLWGWGIDGHRPDRYDWIGAAVVGVGVGVIFFAPRG
jgi:hypothetical protein